MEAERSLFPTNKKWGTQKTFCAQEPHMVLLSFKSWCAGALVVQVLIGGPWNLATYGK